MKNTSRPLSATSFANRFARCAATCLFAVCLAGQVLAKDSPGLIGFTTDEGMARLVRSPAKADFSALANQFEAQPNSLFCGPTSAAIVLNALFGPRQSHANAGTPVAPITPNPPRDRQGLSNADERHLPPGADPTLPRFTPDTVIGRGAKTRAQVFGEPMNIGGKMIKDFGYQLRQLEQMLQANGARTQLHIVDERQTDQAIRATLIDNLKRNGDYVIVNYLRRNVGQNGGGHISPLAAYDAETDAFLVLDVNPAAAEWVWMPAETLIKGMRSFDTVENRGFLLLQAP